VRLDYACISEYSFIFWLVGGLMIVLTISAGIAIRNFVLPILPTINGCCCYAPFELILSLLAAVLQIFLFSLFIIFLPISSFIFEKNIKGKFKGLAFILKYYQFMAALSFMVHPLVVFLVIFIVIAPFNLSERGFVEQGSCIAISSLAIMQSNCPVDNINYFVYGQFNNDISKNIYNFTINIQYMRQVAFGYAYPLQLFLVGSLNDAVGFPAIPFAPLSPFSLNTCFRNPSTGNIAFISNNKFSPDIDLVIGDQPDTIRMVVGVICGIIFAFGIIFSIIKNPWCTMKDCCACCYVVKNDPTKQSPSPSKV